VSAVKYELGFYIPEDNILHSDRHENLINLTSALLTGIWAVSRRPTVSELGVRGSSRVWSIVLIVPSRAK
jgi:hypothetical protein